MMHKIRALMGKRDSQYQLKNTLEMDDAFVTTFRKSLECDSPHFTRGRGSERQTKMFVMAESLADDAFRRRSKPGFIRMVALDVLSADAAEIVAKESIKPEIVIKKDGYRGFSSLKKTFANHQSKVIPPKRRPIDLPWVHIAIANVKATIPGKYRKISDRWIQNYLDENCYRFNRRFLKGKQFERLAVIAVLSNPIVFN
jgi:hypothetical protein